MVIILYKKGLIKYDNRYIISIATDEYNKNNIVQYPIAIFNVILLETCKNKVPVQIERVH